MEKVFETIIDKRDRRYWAALPHEFERDAVRTAYGDLHPYIPGTPRSIRNKAAEATTFAELRAIMEKAEY